MPFCNISSSKQDFIQANTVTKNQNDIFPEIPKEPIEMDLQVAATETIKESKQDDNKCAISERDYKTKKKKQIKFGNGDASGELGCVVCCVKNADAVLLPCNHGGICFECANTIAEQNQVCHLCRKVMSHHIKILNRNFGKS